MATRRGIVLAVQTWMADAVVPLLEPDCRFASEQRNRVTAKLANFDGRRQTDMDVALPLTSMNARERTTMDSLLGTCNRQVIGSNPITGSYPCWSE